MKIPMKINEIFPEITLHSIRDFEFNDLHFMQILDHIPYTFGFLASIQIFISLLASPWLSIVRSQR